MDSLSQLALGAAVGVAVAGRRAPVRAALWGAAFGTLPDLDVLIDYGDPVRNFTFHRGFSHSLFWLTVVAPLLAWLPTRLHAAAGMGYRPWLLLTWLALVTHPLLDAFTVYGTQLLLPFSDYPVALGSIFIIDPLFTLPLLIGTALALAWFRRAPDRAARANTIGLGVGCVYLLWSLGVQTHVHGVALRTLAAESAPAGRLLVTPSPFNTLLWRIVVMEDDGYREGYHSLFDATERVAFVRHRSEPALLTAVSDDWAVQRLAWFSKGFYAVSKLPAAERPTPAAGGFAVAAAEAAGTPATTDAIVVADLRMGQTPWFVFRFIVAEQSATGARVIDPVQLEAGRPAGVLLQWLTRRIGDESVGAPPMTVGDAASPLAVATGTQ